MGNKQSRSKSDSDVPTNKKRKKDRGKKGGSFREEDAKKHQSMPELGGAVPNKKDEDVKVIMYRSYRDLERSKTSVSKDDHVDYKLYRRSTGGIPEKPRTLPRNFGRSKTFNHPVRDAYTPNGSIDPGFPGLDPRDRVNSASKGSFRSSKRASRASSFTSAVSQFQPSDFPTTEEIKAKLSKFEEIFTRKLVSKFNTLAEDTQIGCIVLARDTGVKNRRVSLKEYMSPGTVVPENLLSAENKQTYKLTIPESLFHGIAHVRSEKSHNEQLIASLARDVVSCIATEAGNELTRIYEYQIALMYDDVSIRIIADHAVDCIMEYIQGHYLDRNSAIRSVIQVYPPNPDGMPKYISGVIGSKELKWDLFEVFKKPGLRKEQLLVSDEVLNDSGIDCQPWQYHYTDDSVPFLYGYRGQMIEWDFIENVYKLDMKENQRFKDEIAYQMEDFHRIYMPYKRLFGFEIMQAYCNQLSDNKRSLADVIKVDPLEGPPERDEILPVYRPLSPSTSAAFTYEKANLENSDLTRAQMADTDLTQTRVNNTKLLMANLDNSRLDRDNITGCDLSYSNLESSEVSPEDLRDVTAKHVLLNESFTQPPGGGLDSPDGTSPDKLNMSVVSDCDGNVMNVANAIDQLKARVIQEEKVKAEEAEAAKIREQNSPTPPISDADVAKRALKKKKKKKRISEVNQSVESPGQTSVTDYNFLDEKKPRILVTPEKPTSPTATVNGTNGHINDAQVNSFFTSSEANATSTPIQQLPPVKAATLPAKPVTDERIRPKKAAPVQYSQSVNEPRSVSQTNLHSDGHTRPINSRYSTVERRPNKPAAGNRMVKAQSHHGQLTSAGNGTTLEFGRSNLPGKQVLSQAEVEHIRKSQIFKMLSGLQIGSLAPILPGSSPVFLGRGEEVKDIADLLNASGRIITLTGCPGVGKSMLAKAVGREMINKHVTPIYMDSHSCTTEESVLQLLMTTFGLHFKSNEMQYFYQWVNSHEQRILFILDNVELDSSLDNGLSGLLDNLLFNVKNLRILSTSHRQFFRGQATHETYRVGDVRQFSEEILKQVIPDCHDEGITQLATAVDHVLLGLHLCGKAFSIKDVDSGKLFEDLASSDKNSEMFSKNRLEDNIAKFTTSEIEQQRLFKVGMKIGVIFEHLSQECRDLLSVMHVIQSDFNIEAIKSLSSLEETVISENLQELVKVGLLNESKGRYCLSRFIRLVISVCWPDDGSNMLLITQYYVDKIKSLNTLYHSNDSYKAMTEVLLEYDNLVATLRWLLEREDTYEYCSSFADMEYAIFLCEVLPQNLYEDFYESLSQQASESDDVITRTNALCCSSYKCMKDTRFENARAYAENAYECIHAAHVSELDKAFCIQCLGKAYWHDGDMKEKGLTLVKCSLDIYKSKYGLKHPKALYSNEEYGKLLTEKDSHQKARHIFNVSDLILSEILDCHPILIPSYDCRRAIWDKLFLFSRSTEIAQKAVDTAVKFYGDHPVTADVLTSLCHCIMKRGSLQDGIKIAVHALAIRVKVLGDHLDTGRAYKMLAYLMMRSSQHDEAVRFAQNGLEVYDKIDAPEKYKIEVKNIIAQGRYKLESRSPAYVEIDSRDASKTNIAGGESNGPVPRKVSNAVSTDV